MKHLMIFCLTFSLFFVACNKECQVDNPPAACSDIASTDEHCLAYFERWFYDSSKNTCKKIGYSGCNQVGFATELECQSCVCLSE